jgi:hypothetical protein
MLEVENDDPDTRAPVPDLGFSKLRRSGADQHRYVLGDRLEGVPSGKTKLGTQLSPPRQLVTRGADEWLPTCGEDFDLMQGLALGGLGAAWCPVSPSRCYACSTRCSGPSTRGWHSTGTLPSASELEAGAAMNLQSFETRAAPRGEKNFWALVVGGRAGPCPRLGSHTIVLGAPLAVRAGDSLDLGNEGERLPVYLLAMLVFMPGGLVLGMLHRGRRWPELIIIVAGLFGAYLVQKYYTFATSMVKRMIITPHDLLPLVPVLAFGMAESLPRLRRGVGSP